MLLTNHKHTQTRTHTHRTESGRAARYGRVAISCAGQETVDYHAHLHSTPDQDQYLQRALKITAFGALHWVGTPDLWPDPEVQMRSTQDDRYVSLWRRKSAQPTLCKICALGTIDCWAKQSGYGLGIWSIRIWLCGCLSNCVECVGSGGLVVVVLGLTYYQNWYIYRIYRISGIPRSVFDKGKVYMRVVIVRYTNFHKMVILIVYYLNNSRL